MKEELKKGLSMQSEETHNIHNLPKYSFQAHTTPNKQKKTSPLLHMSKIDWLIQTYAPMCHDKP